MAEVEDHKRLNNGQAGTEGRHYFCGLE
jgi:hypothetical protein